MKPTFISPSPLKGEGRGEGKTISPPHPSLSPKGRGSKRVTILGATGTIGRSTLKLIEAHPDRFEIETLTASDNVAELAQLAIRFGARRAVIASPDKYDELKNLLSGSNIHAAAGAQALEEAAATSVDLVMSAIVGIAGLRPTLAAIRAGQTVALANKESLVCAGSLMMEEVSRHGATLLPVDSEHNGVFQLLSPELLPAITSITLTASGGPFRTWSHEQMKTVTPEQAVKHPNWSMGAKISVDSATLMNKGLELIEAQQLFQITPDKLSVLIHPQSIIHCLIHLKDGSVLSQMSHPDMITPIACAMAWPQRISAPVRPLDLAAIGSLTFEQPDETRFPALRLAREVMATGGSAPCVLNAANEIAVKRFLAGEIGFLDIAKIVERTLETTDNTQLRSIGDVLAADSSARRNAERL
ncbi:MAG: 1-deoxy-D-xylulose-5-phosphate reductoisomerase [Alphaproteobacteria bacterium]|nr:1-deoxy-D-xylulose-5-phosphate reductoisomerase [Alphaproteobacteria bacterium]